MHSQAREAEGNQYDNSKPIELDWETNDERMDRAVSVLSDLLSLEGHKGNVKKHIRTFLIVCGRMEKYAPDEYIAYSRNNNADSGRKTRNPKHIKLRKMREIVDALVGVDWLEHVKGKHYSNFKRHARFKPVSDFRDFIRTNELHQLNYFRILVTQGIILKDNNKRVVTEYQETPVTQGMKERLDSYNRLIVNTDINLAGQVSEEIYFFDNKQSYRIFSNSSFEQNGRFYGGWWTRCKKADRRYITINGRPTVELDYKANHLCLLYGLANTPIPENMRTDPYQISNEYPRQLVKAAFTKSINADDERKAWGAFNDDMQTNDDLAEWRHLSQLEHYRELIRQLRHHHPVINDYIHSNHGLSLMYHDSRVAAWVLDSMTAHNGEGISCLCVHDSFLVDARHEAVLRAYMEEAYRALGMPHGLPEIRATQSALA